MKLVIINGPNLNLLGSREKEVYGETSFDKYLLELKQQFDVELDYYQSNVEGELINYMQHVKCDGMILNAGGYSHKCVYS